MGPDRRRRRLLRAGAALPLLACTGEGAWALTRGDATISVRAQGARGDGRSDDTRAFQQAIAALPAAGGTVLVPPGRYLLDAVRGVRLRSRMHLRMDPDAVLVTIPNAAERSVLLVLEDISDVEVSGGRIVGDRDRHLGTAGEWGHGLQTRGAQRVVVRDLHVSDCWGDGLSVAGLKAARGRPRERSADVLLERVVATGNRRQGLTIGGATRVQVRDSEFSDTRGTAPEAGIDIEPDVSLAEDIRISGCRIHGNRGPGVQVYKRTRGVAIGDCLLEGNRYGVLVVGGEDTRILGNRIRASLRNGIAVQGPAQGVRIGANTFGGNARKPGLSASALLPRWGGGPPKRDIAVDDEAQGVRIDADNRFD